MASKELSQDSKADKSQQLKKETKDQQKDAQRQRGNLLRLRREVLYRFQGSVKCIRDCGGLAQLGERLPCKQEVSGSIPLISTKYLRRSEPRKYGPIAQLARAHD